MLSILATLLFVALLTAFVSEYPAIGAVIFLIVFVIIIDEATK